MFSFLRNPSYQGLIISILLAVIVMWVYLARIDNKNYFVLDNPTNNVIEVQLDNKSYTLAPYQSVHVKVNEGEHQIIAKKGDSLLLDGKINNSNAIRGLINPTRSEYVIYKRYYGKSINRDSLIYAHQGKVDSTLYYGELRTTDSLFIQGFYLNVDQKYPAISKSMDTISSIPKIFRKDSFKTFYQENYQ